MKLRICSTNSIYMFHFQIRPSYKEIIIFQESDYVEIQGEVQGPKIEAKIVTKVDGVTSGLRYKTLSALKSHYNLLYTNKV